MKKIADLNGELESTRKEAENERSQLADLKF